MTHDIAHCNNESCPAKDRCKRFILYLEDCARHFPPHFCSYFYMDDEQKERVKRLGSCQNFLHKED